MTSQEIMLLEEVKVWLNYHMYNYTDEFGSPQVQTDFRSVDEMFQDLDKTIKEIYGNN